MSRIARTTRKQITAAFLCASGCMLFTSGVMANQPQIFGLHEHVALHELALNLPAKLDTGAETASLSAKNIEVNLTDRSAFEYPLLIGATALKEFNAAVSPGVRYSAGQPSCAKAT